MSRARRTKEVLEELDPVVDPTEYHHYVSGGGGFVYLVFDSVSGLYKVGATTNLDSRVRNLATSTSNELWLIWFIASNDHVRLEIEWKRLWTERWVTGEWFRLTASHVSWFGSVKAVEYKSAYPTAYVPRWNPLIPPPRRDNAKGIPRRPIHLGAPIPRRGNG